MAVRARTEAIGLVVFFIGGGIPATVRPHWALVPPDGDDPLTPIDVFLHGQAVDLPKWQR